MIFNTGAAQKYVEAMPTDLPRLDKDRDRLVGDRGLIALGRYHLPMAGPTKPFDFHPAP